MATYAQMPQIRANSRHVVFAHLLRENRRPVNFGPDEPADRPPDSSLALHKRLFVRWLFEQADLDATCYRQETLARRLPACLRLLRVRDVHEARAAIEAEPALVSPAIGTLVIGITDFFRDDHVFQALRQTILPLLIDAGRTLRIWSVGCSDGQELYSVMMILAEMGWLLRADLLGTDCRAHAVHHARNGCYSDHEVRSVPPEMLRRYFGWTDLGWRIDSRLRTVVQWRTADAIKLIEPGSWDLVLCRNFAMYLEPRAVALLWENVYRALRPGRFLVAGKAERPSVDGLHPIAPCIFRRN